MSISMDKHQATKSQLSKKNKMVNINNHETLKNKNNQVN